MLIVVFILIGGLLLTLAAGAFLLAQLRGQGSEIAHRLSVVERPMPVSQASPTDLNWTNRFGHPMPSLLNDFALPNLADGTTTLSQWRGEDIALIYVQADCPHSERLLEILRDRPLAARMSDPIPVIVATGNPDWYRSFLVDHLSPNQFAMQQETEVARLHRVPMTPAAYFVDPTSVTESPQLLGVEAIIDAFHARGSFQGTAYLPSPLPSKTTPLPPPTRVLLKPLSVGQTFPVESLPDTIQSALRAEAVESERRTIVIVDPICPACLTISGTLSSDSVVSFTLVATGDNATNQQFADVSGSSNRLVHDPTQSIGIAIGTLITPSAVIVDQRGQLAAPVAIGPAETIALLSDRQQRPGSTPQRHRSRHSQADRPLVSAIITTRDRPSFMRFAVSVFERQRYPNRELIVVDDGDQAPVDPTLVEAIGGRLVRVPVGTPIGAKLNAGLEVARGIYCQKMDDDDWYAPAYIETMVARFQESERDGCRPAIAFVTPFLFFDVARWEIRRSRDRNVPGATLFFRRADWERHPFRPLPGDEDLWFYLDQLQAHARMLAVAQPELFMAVRHRGSQSERGHTWVNQMDTRPLEDYLLERPLHDRTPEQVLPDWALSFYRGLQRDLLHSQPTTIPAPSSKSGTSNA